LFLLFVVLFACSTVRANDYLDMVASPSKSMAPATIRVRLKVEPMTDNRVLDVVADSGEFYRLSEVSLDGASAPRTITVEFSGLPGGTYVLHGELRTQNGERRASVFQEITVLPSNRAR
jgi:hypothetical protein